MSYSFTKIKAISFWECPAYKNPEKRWFKRLQCTVVDWWGWQKRIQEEVY
jgi:hypothetical protein